MTSLLIDGEKDGAPASKLPSTAVGQSRTSALSFITGGGSLTNSYCVRVQFGLQQKGDVYF